MAESDNPAVPINPLDPTQSDENSEAMPSGREFPAKYATNRPKYARERVLDYLLECEELMALTKVTTDRVKKMILCYYLDYGEQQLWTQIKEYKTGSYDEYKKKILEFHPAALKITKGDLATLRMVCQLFIGVMSKN